MTEGRSYRFTHFLCREPARSVTDGLRAGGGPNPDADLFARQHSDYVAALRQLGDVTALPPLDAFPDSVFIEDAALCAAGCAIQLRPGAPSRFGEAAALRPALEDAVGEVIDLPDNGRVDGGDVLLSDNEAFIGLSARTDEAGFDALANVLSNLGYRARRVETPPEILHFKTDCGLLDSETIFSTRALAATGCFEGYRVIQAPAGEEAAANLIRVNDLVFVAAGHPKTCDLLSTRGYEIREFDISEAAKVDGGLSCMSLRFSARTTGVD